jgi:tRNA pseudouridine55 synthase
MNGIVLVDKPQGVTSFDVVRQLRRFCQTRQVGHCGTLDPLATGLLPVAVGSATRLVEYLMADEKEYLATLALGAVTDTQDATGQLLATYPWDDVTPSALAAACQLFTGAIAQIPPMYSALKRDGVPLYRLARQGLEVERAARDITISLIEILEFTPPLASIRVVCSKGTYIRTLVHDLGQQLGCGAHLTALRRVRCGVLTVDASYTPDELQALAEAGGPLPVMSATEAMAAFPVVAVQSSAWGRLANGVAPLLAEVDGVAQLSPGTLLCLHTDGRLAAVASFAPGGEGGRPGDFALRKVFPDAIMPP